MLKLEKRITLHTFDVEYIDQREPKPRAVHHELCVLDGGRVSALERLGQSPASWICQQYARQGFTVGAVHKGERLTANVDTATLGYGSAAGWHPAPVSYTHLTLPTIA